MRMKTITWSVLGVVAVVLAGCSEAVPAPAHNRDYVTVDGRFVGHLKPEKGPPIGPDGERIKAHDPVVWIVVDGEVSQPEYERDVNSYRIDFDERQPLTEANLPFALMTEQTRQVVVHRGRPPADFSHPQINDGEPCAPVYRCANFDCPRVEEIDNFALFPEPEGAEPVCPFCGNEEVEPYVIPQHVHMQKFLSQGAIEHADGHRLLAASTTSRQPAGDAMWLLAECATTIEVIDGNCQANELTTLQQIPFSFHQQDLAPFLSCSNEQRR